MTADTSAGLYGHIAKWPTKGQLTSLLRSGGLSVTERAYSIRIEDFSDFVFQEYGGDMGDPQIDADAADAETLAAEAQKVSDILAKAGIAHRFEIYQGDDEQMTHCLHHNWT